MVVLFLQISVNALADTVWTIRFAQKFRGRLWHFNSSRQFEKSLKRHLRAHPVRGRAPVRAGAWPSIFIAAIWA
ncbi:hypothetical protein [Comamonas badia]|uniref:hypothetical protein n=1 Tax=Comamonas badia TaxID=265291 RepID=UPI0012EC52AB|nr:hypothetical protein [Comamonas badia]